MKNHKRILQPIVACFVLLICIVTLSACFQGPKGARGEPGIPGETVYASYMDVLEYLWANMSSSEKAAYGNNFTTFIIEWSRENLQGQQGPPGAASDSSLQYAANMAVQSAVDITASRTGTHPFSGQAGAGVFYKLDLSTGNGYIITNYHVVSAYHNVGGLVVANNVRVYLYGLPPVYNSNGTVSSENALPARVIGGSPDHDVAILEIRGGDTALISGTSRTIHYVLNYVAAVREAVPASKREPALGTQVVAVGNPLADTMSVTDGIISVQSEEIKMPRLDKRKSGGKIEDQAFRVMRISAAINPGNSGGGLYNANGELVGIVQARMFWADDTGDYPVDNMAYAIPLDVALRVADQIILRAPAEYVPPSGNTNAVIVMLKKFEPTLAVAAKNTTVTYDPVLTEIVIKETVYVTKAGNGRAVNDEIGSITIGDKPPYPITRLYQVDELMIEGYQKTVVFNKL